MSLPPIGTVWRTAFEITPIVLVNGLASFMPGGGMLPIAALTETINMPAGLLAGADVSDLDGFFAHFLPMPGGTLIEQDLARYPFANNSVAANAVIAQPLMISMEMICPVRERFGYATKLATMTALQTTLAQHNASGGTYTIATPSRFYQNCVFLRMVDASGGGDKQAQTRWRLDFEQPLLTLEQAQQAQNSLMSKFSDGVAVGGDPPPWSGLPPTVGSPASVAGPGVVPALSGPAGASVAPNFAGT